MYTALFCYQIMALIEKIVHYVFLLLFGPVLKLVYLSTKVEKRDTILHNIHPGPFDSTNYYGHTYINQTTKYFSFNTYRFAMGEFLDRVTLRLKFFFVVISGTQIT